MEDEFAFRKIYFEHGLTQCLFLEVCFVNAIVLNVSPNDAVAFHRIDKPDSNK